MQMLQHSGAATFVPATAATFVPASAYHYQESQEELTFNDNSAALFISSSDVSSLNDICKIFNFITFRIPRRRVG